MGTWDEIQLESFDKGNTVSRGVGDEEGREGRSFEKGFFTIDVSTITKGQKGEGAALT